MPSPTAKPRKHIHRNRLLMLGILAVGVFVLLIGVKDIASSHEGRVAATARTMADSGWPWNAHPVTVPGVRLHDNDGELSMKASPDGESLAVNPWMIPVVNGQIRLQKPPLPYWSNAIAFRLMGRSALSARLVPAVLGLLATLLIYDLARVLMGRPAAWLAGLLWVSSYFVPEEYRKTMADPYLAFFTLVCVWAWVRCAMAGASRSARYAAGWLLIFYCGIGLGLLAKGPPLLVHLVIALGAFHLCYRRRIPGRWWIHGLGIALVAAIALPWAIYVYSHIPHVIEFWRYESIGEMSDNVENARPWWFYLPQLPLVAMPWLVLWILGFVAPFTKNTGASRRRMRAFFPLAWYAVTVLFFSFVNLKKNAYLLPVMPAQTLLMVQGAILLAVWLKQRPRQWLPRVAIVVQAGIGASAAIWLGTVLLFGPFKQPIPAGILLSMVALIAGGYPLWKSLALDRSTHEVHLYRRWLTAQSVGYAILLSLFFNFYDAPKDNLDSSRRFIAAVAPLLNQPGCTLVRQGMKPEMGFYLPGGLADFDPSADCVLVMQEIRRKHPPRAPLNAADLGLNGEVAQITNVQIPGITHWKLWVLRMRHPTTRPSDPM